MKLRVIVTMLALSAAGCASVSVGNQWKDPEWAGPPVGNIVVVGIARSDTTRRVFEDTFVSQLRTAGIKAEPSYTQIPPGEGASVKLSDLVKASGADAVMVTRVQRVDRKVDVDPGYGGVARRGFYGWYGSAWVASPTVTQYDVVTLETSVWDPKNDKLVWSATTQRVASQDIPKVTTELASTLIPKMKSDGVLR